MSGFEVFELHDHAVSKLHWPCPALHRFKPFLPVYWAFQEIKAQLQPDRSSDNPLTQRAMWNMLRWEEFLRVGLEMRAHCSQIAQLLQQPVPWPYFHILNLMTIIVLVLVSYGLVGMAPWPISLVA